VSRWGSRSTRCPASSATATATARSPPAAASPRGLVNQGYHHALLAHGHGVAAVRAHGGPGATVGLVHNHLPAPQVPVTETEADIAAARAAYERTNRQLLGPLCWASIPTASWRRQGPDAPHVEPGDLEWIAQPTDYLGLKHLRRRLRPGRPRRRARAGPLPPPVPPRRHVLALPTPRSRSTGRPPRRRGLRRADLPHHRERRGLRRRAPAPTARSSTSTRREYLRNY